MFIETNDDYAIFRKETKYHNNFLISVIPEDDVSIHAAASKLSVIFLKDLEINKTYIFSFDHPDNPKHIDWNMFKIDLTTNNWIWVFDKKSAYQLTGIPNFLDIDLYTHLKENRIVDRNETNAHKLIKRNNYGQRYLNKIIPIFKHQEMFEKMCEDVFSMPDFPKKWNEKIDDGYRNENSITSQTLADLEKTGIHINLSCFKNHFPNAIVHDGDMVYSQYNLYTSTGRPSNRFDGVNYAALNKHDGSRKCFTSRFGNEGKMVLIDFSAFHPRIISYLIKFPLDINVNIYEYLGELYFNRKITEYDMDEIKSITMRQFYGGVEEKYQHIKYLSHTNNFINQYWQDFKKNGFIKTPIFKRIITDKHLLDPNPPKVLNYILQATETEIATMILREIQHFLLKYKTKAVLYTYDSILFDFYKSDGEELLNKIANIMKMIDKFPIKVYEGESYDSIVQIYL